VLSKLMAPFMPFFSEALYLSLSDNKESVHLESWPKPETSSENTQLSKNMALIRSLATEALALRAENQIKVRQPLQSITVKDDSLSGKEELLEILKDEINVKKIKFDANLKSEKGITLNTKLSPALVEEGIVRELARAVQGLRQDANYKMSDQITLYIAAEKPIATVAQKHESKLKKMVNAEKIEFKMDDKHDAIKESKISGKNVTLAVRKI